MNPRYGLRYFDQGREIRLHQIGGDGRLMLVDGGAYRWVKRPRCVVWSVFETHDGQTYDSASEALRVAARLVG